MLTFPPGELQAGSHRLLLFVFLCRRTKNIKSHNHIIVSLSYVHVLIYVQFCVVKIHPFHMGTIRVYILEGYQRRFPPVSGYRLKRASRFPLHPSLCPTSESRKSSQRTVASHLKPPPPFVSCSWQRTQKPFVSNSVSVLKNSVDFGCLLRYRDTNFPLLVTVILSKTLTFVLIQSSYKCVFALYPDFMVSVSSFGSFLVENEKNPGSVVMLLILYK